MKEKKRFLVDVGIRDLPFPMKVISRENTDGQQTIANISISTRIMQEFEAHWIDKFIQIVHEHRERIGTKTLRANIFDYLHELQATVVKIDFDYPFFTEKTTPVSKQNCLVRHLCTYSAKVSTVEDNPKVLFKVEVPVVTTYPGSIPDEPGGLFGQLSIVIVEVEAKDDIYPEDLIELVDKHALSPIYSFLSEEDQAFIIQKVHSEEKYSVMVLDGIKEELARNPLIGWYSVRCSNYGMLHSYSTIISTEKSMWVPFSSYES
jgi:GTP cyclohydrolase I